MVQVSHLFLKTPPISNRAFSVLSIYQDFDHAGNVAYAVTELGGRSQGSIEATANFAKKSDLPVPGILSAPYPKGSRRSRASEALSRIRVRENDRTLVGPIRHINHACSPNCKVHATTIQPS
jgi:hypothetical protein